jgi:DeoR/GlpR family transcriptional regulator of sugar metabolism
VLAEERRRVILETLSNKGSVAVTELARQLEVSSETIRRDIALLDKQSRLRRTHGGAMPLDTAEPMFTERMTQNIEGKRAIGWLAASLVGDGASVIIDSGTSAFCVAEALADRRRLKVYTPGLQAATRLAGRNDNEVYLLGGRFASGEGATVGPDATAMLSHYFADFAFVGAGVISRHPWLMDYSREAADLRAEMIVRARTAVLLADRTKFNRMAPYVVANLDEVSHIVTDAKPDKAMAKALRTLPAAVLVAERRGD